MIAEEKATLRLYFQIIVPYADKPEKCKLNWHYEPCSRTLAGTKGLFMQLHQSSWPEVEAYLTRSKAIVIPIGSTEQHGPNSFNNA